MMNWGEFRAMVRRSLLQDTVPDEESGEYRWSDEALRDFCWWALGIFAKHTAMATSTSFVGNGKEYELPQNILTEEPFDISAEVFVTNTSGQITYLNPTRFTDFVDRNKANGFYTYPSTHLILTTELSASDTLTVRYFAHYNRPYADTDTIDVPLWGEMPLAYLIAAHALSGDGIKSANIRQWGAKPDTGTPEHNPLRKQQQWFLDMYEREMESRRPQDRINHWRDGVQLE